LGRTPSCWGLSAGVLASTAGMLIGVGARHGRVQSTLVQGLDDAHTVHNLRTELEREVVEQ